MTPDQRTQIDREIQRIRPAATARWRAWLRSPDGQEAIRHVQTGLDIIREFKRRQFWRLVREIAAGMVAAAVVLALACAFLVWLSRGNL